MFFHTDAAQWEDETTTHHWIRELQSTYRFALVEESTAATEHLKMQAQELVQGGRSFQAGCRIIRLAQTLLLGRPKYATSVALTSTLGASISVIAWLHGYLIQGRLGGAMRLPR